MAEQAIIDRSGIHRVILKEDAGGVYVFIYESPTSAIPEKDWYYDTMEQAREFCRSEFCLNDTEWTTLMSDTKVP